MRYLFMLIVLTAMVFVAAGSTKGNSSQGPQPLDPTAVASPKPNQPHPPPPRSKRCPPKTNDDTPHGNCGKGDNSHLP
jgi:hypothetical protein